MWIIFKLIYSIALPCIVGHQAFSFITGKQQKLSAFNIAISFGLGFGILTQGMLWMGIFKLKYTALTISLMLLFIAFILTRLLKFSSSQKNTLTTQKLTEQNKFKFSIWTIIAIIIIAYYLIYSFWISLNIPVYTWDSFATCIYNAKVIYFDNSLQSFRYFSHATYPLHIPMLTAWVSFNLGQWDDQLFKIIFPLTFIAFAIIYHNFLSSKTNKNLALLGVLMLFSSNLIILHTTIAYRDLTTMFYNCLTIIFLLIWKDQEEDSYLILAALFSGFGTFLKQEGTAHLLVHILLMLFILYNYKKNSLKNKFKKSLKFFIPSLSIFALFHIYKLTQDVASTSYLNLDIPNAIQRIPFVLQRFSGALFFTANWNILWSFLIISIMLNVEKIKKNSDIQTLLVAIILFLGLLISLSAIVGKDFITHDLDISRVIMHFFPLCPLAIILLIHSEEGNVL